LRRPGRDERRAAAELKKTLEMKEKEKETAINMAVKKALEEAAKAQEEAAQAEEAAKAQEEAAPAEEATPEAQDGKDEPKPTEEDS
jgi:hypothetical protein